jgi:CRISPR system Cascade subunit CasE
MTNPQLFMSRATLLLPPIIAGKPEVEHRLIWSLFDSDPDASREFLYCHDKPSQDGAPRYIVLSQRPLKSSSLFSVESKLFEPNLSVNDRLIFALTANPAINRTHSLPDGTKKAQRHDVVMDALYTISKGERAEARQRVIFEAGFKWLSAQGERAGFVVKSDELQIQGYQKKLIRREGVKDISVSILIFTGVLTISDPALFMWQLPKGFGRAKAFGFGLMQIRRAL